MAQIVLVISSRRRAVIAPSRRGRLPRRPGDDRASKCDRNLPQLNLDFQPHLHPLRGRQTIIDSGAIGVEQHCSKQSPAPARHAGVLVRWDDRLAAEIIGKRRRVHVAQKRVLASGKIVAGTFGFSVKPNESTTRVRPHSMALILARCSGATSGVSVVRVETSRMRSCMTWLCFR